MKLHLHFDANGVLDEMHAENCTSDEWEGLVTLLKQTIRRGYYYPCEVSLNVYPIDPQRQQEKGAL